MAKGLLNRQASLLGYLTSAEGIFGDADDAKPPAVLRGIDRDLLRLEAKFSHEKRMEKIAAVFPRTFECLGRRLSDHVRQFATTCPPRGIGRLENARQFYGFLRSLWSRSPPRPRYLPDIAACELARAEVRVELVAGQTSAPRDLGRSMRRHPAVRLLRCDYDVRAMFEGEAPRTAPAKRRTFLAVAISSEAHEPHVMHISSPVFDLLAALDEWTTRAAFSDLPEVDALIIDLATMGLIEVRA